MGRLVSELNDDPPLPPVKKTKSKPNHKSNKRETQSGSAAAVSFMSERLLYHSQFHYSRQLISCIARHFIAASSCINKMADQQQPWSSWKKSDRRYRTTEEEAPQDSRPEEPRQSARESSRPAHSEGPTAHSEGPDAHRQSARESSRPAHSAGPTAHSEGPDSQSARESSRDVSTSYDQIENKAKKLPFEARDPIDFDKNAEGWQTMATKAGMAIGYATNHDAVVNRLKETPRETTAASMLKQLGNEFYFLQHKGVLKGKRIAETVDKLRDGSILHKASSYANQRVKTAFIVSDSIFDLGFTTQDYCLGWN